MGAITLEQLRSAVALMRKNAVPPSAVKSKKEARELTHNDPCGHKWKVGDEYYSAETLQRTMPVSAKP